MKRISFKDLGNYTPKEIMQKYKITPRQLEQSLSHEIRGASKKETKEIYHKVYDAGLK